MARSTIKGTYALDAETVRLLERMARKLGISKSEALRRAIRSAAERSTVVPDAGAAELNLDLLQKAAGLGRKAADSWAKRLRNERHASGRATD